MCCLSGTLVGTSQEQLLGPSRLLVAGQALSNTAKTSYSALWSHSVKEVLEI